MPHRKKGNCFARRIATAVNRRDRAESARDLAGGSARTAQGSAEIAEQAKNEAVKAAESIKNTKVPTKTERAGERQPFLTADTEISWGRKADTTIGEQSVALGVNVEASGYQSHAEGSNTTASGKNSHAEGSSAVALGYCSHAEGEATIARGNHSHVQGIYNVEDINNKYAHIVGNGTGITARKNIHTLDWKGMQNMQVMLRQLSMRKGIYVYISGYFLAARSSCT